MKKLHDISLRSRYLWVEDLFVTGLLTKYYNAAAANQSRISHSSKNSFDNSVKYPAQIHLEDQSKLYLNEQYDTYKKWIEDSTQKTNPWMFILLEVANDQDLVIEQKALWEKTVDLLEETSIKNKVI